MIFSANERVVNDVAKHHLIFVCLASLPAIAAACSPRDLYAEAFEAREKHRLYCTSGGRDPLTCHGPVADEMQSKMEAAEAALRGCGTKSSNEAVYYKTLYEFPMVASAAESGASEYRRALRSQINTFERLYNEGYLRPACLLSSFYEQGLPGIEASKSRAILWGQRCVESAVAEGSADDAFAALDRLRGMGAHPDVLNALQEKVGSMK